MPSAAVRCLLIVPCKAVSTSWMRLSSCLTRTYNSPDECACDSTSHCPLQSASDRSCPTAQDRATTGFCDSANHTTYTTAQYRTSYAAADRAANGPARQTPDEPS